LHKQRIPAVIS